MTRNFMMLDNMSTGLEAVLGVTQYKKHKVWNLD